MARKTTPEGRADPLSSEDTQKFLEIGIPYRLEMLALGRDVAPASSSRDSAFVEAAIINGRLLLQFLGLGVSYEGGALHLVERRGYHQHNGFTDEVKVTDLGGTFVDLASLDEDSKGILAMFHEGASKASAHLTWDSGHGLDLKVFKQSMELIKSLVESHLPQIRKAAEAASGGNR